MHPNRFAILFAYDECVLTNLTITRDSTLRFNRYHGHVISSSTC